MADFGRSFAEAFVPSFQAGIQRVGQDRANMLLDRKFRREEEREAQSAQELAALQRATQGDLESVNFLARNQQDEDAKRTTVNTVLGALKGLTSTEPGPARDAVVSGYAQSTPLAQNVEKFLRTAKGADLSEYVSSLETSAGSGDVDAQQLQRSLANPVEGAQALTQLADVSNQRRQDPEGFAFQARMRAIGSRVDKLTAEAERIQRVPFQTPAGLKAQSDRLRSIQSEIGDLTLERDRLSTPQVSSRTMGDIEQQFLVDPSTGEIIPVGESTRDVILREQGAAARSAASIAAANQRSAASISAANQRAELSARSRVTAAGRIAQGEQVGAIPLTSEEREAIGVGPEAPLFKTTKGDIKALPFAEKSISSADRVAVLTQAKRAMEKLKAHVERYGALSPRSIGVSRKLLNQRQTLASQALFAVGPEQARGALQEGEMERLAVQIQDAVATGGAALEFLTGAEGSAKASLDIGLERLDEMLKDEAGKPQTLTGTKQKALEATKSRAQQVIATLPEDTRAELEGASEEDMELILRLLD